MQRENVTIVFCSVGYAFHLVLISLLGWNGTLIFMPQAGEGDILLWFNATQLIFFPATFLLAAYLSYRWNIDRRVKEIVLAGIVLIALGLGFLVLGTRVNELILSRCLFAGAGMLTGIGNSACFLSWQSIFSSQQVRSAGLEIVMGTGAAGLIYLIVIQLKPGWFPLAMLVVSFCINCFCLISKTGEVRAGGEEGPLTLGKNEWGRLFDLIWRPAFCIASLAFARGVAPALVLDDSLYGPALSTLMTFGRILSALLFFLLWKQIASNVASWTDRVYSVAVILVATGFVLLPIFGKGYQFLFACAVYTIFGVASLFMMLWSVSLAKSQGFRPLMVYGLFAGFVYLFSKTGFGAAYYAHGQTEFGFMQLAMVGLLSVYIILLMYFASRRRSARTLVPPEGDCKSGESWAGAKEPPSRDAQDNTGNSGISSLAIKDVLHENCIAVATESGLSTREIEIMGYLALGRSVPYIAESLFISENTVRTHCKNIYRKLGIHSKRELMDLVECREYEKGGESTSSR